MSSSIVFDSTGALACRYSSVGGIDLGAFFVDSWEVVGSLIELGGARFSP